MYFSVSDKVKGESLVNSLSLPARIAYSKEDSCECYVKDSKIYLKIFRDPVLLFPSESELDEFLSNIYNDYEQT